MQQKKTTAIILSYLRPQNIESICETLLLVPQISQIIVSNNNPDIDIHEYIELSDDRLLIIDQEEKCPCFKRYEIAHNLDADYFIAIDDDLFIDENQITYLLKKLADYPDSPHGFWGQTYKIEGDRFSYDYCVVNQNREIDILNRLYLFTKTQVNEMFKIIKEAEIPVNEIGFCDDILISFSGTKKPLMHAIGKYFDCITVNKKGIAQCQEPDFEERRTMILKKVLAKKSFDNELNAH